jgi:DNA-binding NarL/FixJ family response regulator
LKKAVDCLRVSHQWNNLCHLPHRVSANPSNAITSDPNIKVAIVDDEPVVRSGLENLLRRSPGFQCVGAYADGESAMSGLPQKPPDVLLMDIQLPGIDGISAIRTLRGQLPNTEIIMLTAMEDHDRIFASFTAGASGYLLKHTAPNKILEAIREVSGGGSPMSAPIARRLVKFFGTERTPPQSSSAPTVASVEANASLTSREREVLDLMAEGLLYKEAADRMGLSVDTIRAHLRNIYKKLRVRNRTEAILKVTDSRQE